MEMGEVPAVGDLTAFVDTVDASWSSGVRGIPPAFVTTIRDESGSSVFFDTSFRGEVPFHDTAAPPEVATGRLRGGTVWMRSIVGVLRGE